MWVKDFSTRTEVFESRDKDKKRPIHFVTLVELGTSLSVTVMEDDAYVLLELLNRPDDGSKLAH